MSKKRVLKKGLICAGDYVLYVVRSAYYVEYNYSLAAAIKLSNELNVTLRVVAWLDCDFRYSNRRNVSFLIDGIQEFAIELNYQLEVVSSDKDLELVVKDSCAVISDTVHSAFQSRCLDSLVNKYNKYIELYENSVIVPCNKAYPKQAYGAYVIRKSLLSKLTDYMIEIDIQCLEKSYNYEQLEFDKLRDDVLGKLEDVEVVKQRGGCTTAKKVMKEFVSINLPSYNTDKKIDLLKPTSRISAFLSNGQISPIMVVKMANFQMETSGYDSFIEQVLVRRELAFNYTFYIDRPYDLIHLPMWAKISIDFHRGDKRCELFEVDDIKNGNTSDFAFNACQRQLLEEGYMHNHMRMYWAKTIISFTKSVEEAFDIMLQINDTYQLDGRGPTAIVGILWNFGLHDRAWFEREVFGKLRYMNYNGLLKKTNILDYIEYYKEK